MLKLLQQFIQQENLFEPKTDKILLALSGGRDSCVLLNLLLQLGAKVGLAHCNFQLRREESTRDQLFCEQLAVNYGLELHLARFETAKYAQIHKLSVQEAARALRYGYFEQIRTEKNYQIVATAHHLNDSIETVLLNLGKGCGIRGLHGILPKQNYIIRPLLFATQAQIRAYAVGKNISFVEDSSNASDKYSRNFIRHHIIPNFVQIYPSFEPTFGENIQRFKQVEQLYTWGVDYWAEKTLFIPNRNDKNVLNISLLEQLEPKKNNLFHHDFLDKNGEFFGVNLEILATAPAPATLLYEWLQNLGFNPQQTAEMANQNTQIGAVWRSHSHQIRKEKTKLLVEKKLQEQSEQKNYFIANKWDDFPLVLSDKEQLKIEFNPTQREKESSTQPKGLILSAEKLIFPLIIRHPQPGDRFCPEGMGGKGKKVGDFLKDAGVKSTDKAKIWLLESNHQIAAVLDMRANHFFVGDSAKPEQMISCYVEKNK